jgi:hypothetical protein
LSGDFFGCHKFSAKSSGQEMSPDANAFVEKFLAAIIVRMQLRQEAYPGLALLCIATEEAAPSLSFLVKGGHDAAGS